MVRRNIIVVKSRNEPFDKPSPMERFRQNLEKMSESSQQLFEKQLTTIAASSIAITVALLDKVIPIREAWAPLILYGGWVCMTVTIVINLWSHRVAHGCHYQTMQDIDTDCYDQKTANDRNRRIGVWNNWTLLFLGMGLFLIMLFITANFILMSKQGNNLGNSQDGKTTTNKIVTPPPPAPMEKKGLQYSTPPPPTKKK